MNWQQFCCHDILVCTPLCYMVAEVYVITQHCVCLTSVLFFILSLCLSIIFHYKI